VTDKIVINFEVNWITCLYLSFHMITWEQMLHEVPLYGGGAATYAIFFPH
jgi:hypothetical protein